jgi:DNA-binding MarR family transcriptional regulator
VNPVNANASQGLPPAVGCTCFKLRSLTRRVTQLYDQVLAPSGLRVTQYSLIASARRRDGMNPPTVSELAQRLFTDRTTLTRNLKPLIDAGFIKVTSGADARSKAVIVTAKGETAYQAARPLWKDAQALMRERAGEARLAALHEIVASVLAQLDEPSDTTDAASGRTTLRP